MQSLYKPLGEKEVMEARFKLLPDGQYDGFVVASKHSISRQGNDMADMTVKIMAEDGNCPGIRDFLIFTPQMLWKIKHFCDSSGQQKIYEAGEFMPEHAEKQHVRVLVGRKTGGLIPDELLQGKPKGSCYPDQNVILDYIPQLPAVDKASNDEFINDKIPF